MGLFERDEPRWVSHHQGFAAPCCCRFWTGPTIHRCGFCRPERAWFFLPGSVACSRSLSRGPNLAPAGVPHCSERGAFIPSYTFHPGQDAWADRLFFTCILSLCLLPFPLLGLRALRHTMPSPTPSPLLNCGLDYLQRRKSTPEHYTGTGRRDSDGSAGAVKHTAGDSPGCGAACHGKWEDRHGRRWFKDNAYQHAMRHAHAPPPCPTHHPTPPFPLPTPLPPRFPPSPTPPHAHIHTHLDFSGPTFLPTETVHALAGTMVAPLAPTLPAPMQWHLLSCLFYSNLPPFSFCLLSTSSRAGGGWLYLG